MEVRTLGQLRGLEYVGGGLIPEALMAAYTGPRPVSQIVSNPGGGGTLTASFDADGAVTGYETLQLVVRWGLPVALGLGLLIGVGATYALTRR